MRLELMTDKQYWDVIRSVHYLFSKSAVNYARGYLKKAQKRYYEKKKEGILAKMKERYENDEEFRLKQIARAKEWNARKASESTPAPI